MSVLRQRLDKIEKQMRGRTDPRRNVYVVTGSGTDDELHAFLAAYGYETGPDDLIVQRIMFECDEDGHPRPAPTPLELMDAFDRRGRRFGPILTERRAAFPSSEGHT